MTSCTIRPSEEKINNFINERFAGKTPPPEENKKALIMVGGPGSGKSSTKSEALKYLHFDESSFVDVDPDEALSSLFENDNGCRKGAIITNGKVFSKAWKEGYNMIYDGTGKNFDNYSKNPVGYLKRKGYYVVLCITLLDVVKALGRIKDRAKISGRDIDEDFTRDVYSHLEIGISKYLGIKCTDLDAILIYNNNAEKPSKPQLLYEMHCPRRTTGVNVRLVDVIGKSPRIVPSVGGRLRKRKTRSLKKRKSVRRRKSLKRRKISQKTKKGLI